MSIRAAIWILLILNPLAAQTLLSLSGSSSAKHGTKMTITISAKGTGANSGAAAMEWQIGLPANYYATFITLPNPIVNLSKTVSCNSTNTHCILSGMNTSLIPNGWIAKITVKIPTARGTISIPLTNVQAATPTGLLQPTSTGPPLQVSIY